MIREITSLLRRIAGRVYKTMMTGWFLTFGAMALPIGFALLTISLVSPQAPPILYVLGWVSGAFGLVSFFIALARSFYEDSERKKVNKKNDDNYRSVMKTMEAIKGQLESIGNKLSKKDKNNGK